MANVALNLGAVILAAIVTSQCNGGRRHEFRHQIGAVWYHLDDYFWHHGELPKSYQAIRAKAESGENPMSDRVQHDAQVSWRRMPPRPGETRPGIGELEITLLIPGRSALVETHEFDFTPPSKNWRPHWDFDPKSREQYLCPHNSNIANTLADMIASHLREGKPPPTSDLKVLADQFAYESFLKAGGADLVEFRGLETIDGETWIVVEDLKAATTRLYSAKGPDEGPPPEVIRAGRPYNLGTAVPPRGPTKEGLSGL